MVFPAGRLAKFIGQSRWISSLIGQCDVTAARWCPLVPMITCFDTADLGLRQNINYRTTEAWQDGGAFTCNRSHGFVLLKTTQETEWPVQGFYQVAWPKNEVF